MSPKTIVWKSEETSGEETLSLDEAAERHIIGTSRFKGGDADLHTSWDGIYRIACDKRWHVREVFIQENTMGHQLDIRSDGRGRWTDKDNKEIAGIRGCIDVDFRATPFTNTLPIRRLQLAVGKTAAIEVAHISAPDLTIAKELQVYTRLAANKWKFEQPSADFMVILSVDDHGFVVHYPGLFRRVE